MGMESVETRTSRMAAALLFTVLALLLAPVGIVVTQVVAQSTGGPGQPQVLVHLDPISDAVAATPAEFRVDESGAATYTVPLFTVPGTAGVVPQLSLNYSSQGSYGPMGRGWSVGGLSSISRCRATREAGDFLAAATPDGNPRPISFDGSDRYCLDGQRLIASGSFTCPAIGTFTNQDLRTEIDTFQRVCLYQAASANGPTFFTVERKDGSISWYGDRDNNTSANRPDGYFESTAFGHTTKAISWAQTRFQDSTGNTIDYHYLKNPAGAGTGEHLISEVRYTGKVALSGQTAPASAPFARIVFNYAARAATAHGKGYMSGGLLTQSRRLDSITSCATIDCPVGMQVRHYLLTYQASPSGNGQDVLIGLQECRDARAEVCVSPTMFEWSTALHDLATAESVGSLVTSGVTLASDHFRGFKLGDINGDGRPDLAIQYLAGAGCSGGTWIISALGTQNTFGQPAFSNITFNCVPANITARGDGAWHLLDYNGDGLDDLFVSSATGTGWRVHPSNGTHFDMSTNLIAGLSPAIPSVASEASQVQLADLNGDGLTDIVYPRGNDLKTRLMTRQAGGFAWGPEKDVYVNAGTVGWPAFGCDIPFNPDVRNCQRTISGMPTTKTGFMQMADFNGDAASDLLIRITSSAEVWNGMPGCIRGPIEMRGAPQEADAIDLYVDPQQAPQSAFAAIDPCWDRVSDDSLYALVADTHTASAIWLNNYAVVSGGNPHAIVIADINGDGLSDLMIRSTASSEWYYRINTGRTFNTISTLPLTSYRDQARLVDVTGDGRADFVHLVNYGSYKGYAVRRALPDGTFAASTPMPGGNARICNGSSCNEQLRIPIFSDFDGDGHADFLSLDISAAYIGLYFSRGSQRFVPRDAIVRITNGLGAKTELAYAPLTNAAVYRRGNTSRNGLNWGRGAPVMDFLAPMYVVSQASSSSPQAGNPNAMASVHYRYANARVQAGGRGFLGFGTIETIDANRSGGHIVTATTYFQNFPFVGMPMQTIKRVVSGAYTPPFCLTVVLDNSCFAAPGTAHPNLGGNWFSDNQQVWQAAPASLATQVPLHVRTLGTEEIARDPFNGAQMSKVATAFSYGANGNVSQTVVDTYTGTAGTPTSTVITANTYSDNAARWRLGRLTASTVTHRRVGQPDVVRTTGFSYQMSGATTGLLTEERLQPGGAANLASTKAHQLDAYGNRLQMTTCAGAATPCSTSGFQFRPAAATHVRRYARVEYDAQGRFPVATYEPFWNSSGGAEQRTSYVVSRNAFGDPNNVLDINNVRTFTVKGWLGRDYFTWQQVRVGSSPGHGDIRSLTNYRTCAQVDCPSGAAFRQQVEVTASPRQWTYFDVLGRPVMQAAETFNVGVANQDVSASCTDYDAAGNPRRVSNPFFLSGTVGANGPTGISGVCSAGARQWTVTTYDVLGRPVLVTAPDNSQASVAYAGLATTKTDPRSKVTTETRNGLGEVSSVTDADGLTVQYVFDAAGNITSVRRNAGSGLITNTFQYDVLGRKVQQNDPDSGVTTFQYNALGELTAQIDALGNRTEHAIDARGRIWRTTVKDFNGLTESQSTFTFDTASNGLGQLAEETITGNYSGWSGQTGTGLSFLREHFYDQLGRPYGSITQVDSQVFGQSVTYDDLGRPWQISDASGQYIKTEYGVRGHAQAICGTDPMVDLSPTCAGADTFQRTMRTDAWGNVARERRGNSAALEVVRSVWATTGRISQICAGNSSCSLVNEQYGWDGAGNLSSHLKEQRYLESFTYDNLNRLHTGGLLMRDGVTVNQSTVTMGYDALGNICSHNGTTYGYASSAGCSGTGSGGPHSVRSTTSGGNTTTYSYDHRGNQVLRNAPGTANDRTIAYSLDDKAHEIQMGSGQRVRFWYAPDGQRYKREEAGKITYYIGGVEAIVQGGVTTFKRYIGGIALQTVVNNVIQNTRYLFHDQLGSLVRIANSNGSLFENLDYMAFGGRRSPSNPHAAGASSPNTPRGYTGHEFVDGTGVIHMNGRIYDSELGRFLQADPVIQAPHNTQGWNAYTYVFNNPFVYTDPTGMISWRQILGIVIVIVAAVTQQYWAINASAKFWGTVGFGALAGGVSTGTWQGAMWGAFSAAVFYGVGSYFEGAKWAQATGTSNVFGGGLNAAGYGAKVLAHGVTGGVMSKLQGGRFGHGFASAGVTQAFGPGIDRIGGGATSYAGVRVAAAAALGGTASKLSGGKFANGALTAAFSQAFNSEAHKVAARTVDVDPSIASSLTQEDHAAIAAANQGLADVASAINASGNREAARLYKMASLHYRRVPVASDNVAATTAAFATTGRQGGVAVSLRIVFFQNFRHFANPAATTYYHGAEILSGGRGAVFWATAHEFGHASVAAGQGSNQPIREFHSNRFAHSLMQHAPSGIDRSTVRCRDCGVE